MIALGRCVGWSVRVSSCCRVRDQLRGPGTGRTPSRTSTHCATTALWPTPAHPANRCARSTSCSMRPPEPLTHPRVCRAQTLRDSYWQRRARQAYWAALSFSDDNVGVIVNAAKEAGLYDNSVIVLWGDHGYQLGENDQWCGNIAAILYLTGCFDSFPACLTYPQHLQV